jgi:hypothetical protein
VKQPLVVRSGQLEAAEDEKVQILRLNIGPSEPVIVTSDTVTLTRTLSHFIDGGSKKVKNILGGDEGDVIILTGDNIDLEDKGNIAKKLKLKADEAVTLVYIAAEWIRVK